MWLFTWEYTDDIWDTLYVGIKYFMKIQKGGSVQEKQF